MRRHLSDTLWPDAPGREAQAEGREQQGGEGGDKPHASGPQDLGAADPQGILEKLHHEQGQGSAHPYREERQAGKKVSYFKVDRFSNLLQSYGRAFTFLGKFCLTVYWACLHQLHSYRNMSKAFSIFSAKCELNHHLLPLALPAALHYPRHGDVPAG